MTLVLSGTVGLPEHASGGFDHGDVHLRSGRVFVAHTANGTLEVFDGQQLAREQTLPGCAEGSGVLCAQDETGHGREPGHGHAQAQSLVFAAARGDGSVLVLDAVTCGVLRRVAVGPRPNGLAWDPLRAELLVADVEDNDVRLVDPRTATCLARVGLPGRPRWCVYDVPRQRFLVNIRAPACVVALAAGTLQQVACIDGLPAGPHGLDLDPSTERAFVGCDAGLVAVLDLRTDLELARVPIGGEPDAIWYNAAAGRLYVAIGVPGLIDVIDGLALAVVQRVATEEGAHTTAFDSRRQRLYVFLPGSCQAAAYDEESG